MIRWILLKLVGIFLPSLISKAVSPGQQTTSNIALNVEFKILDNELGDKIPYLNLVPQDRSLRFEDQYQRKKVLQPDETFLFTTGFSIHIKDSKYAALILP